jgi:hypothetical protein
MPEALFTGGIMEDIVIKTTENGYVVTHAGKTYISTPSAKRLTLLINKLLAPKLAPEGPPPLPAAAKKPKKVALE